MKRPINISLMGRSGCGKGTQAKLLIEHFGKMHYLSTGDLLRSLAKLLTLTGQKIKQILNEGGLPFDDIAIALMIYDIAHNVKEDEGIVFDGAVRRVEEAQQLDRFLNWLEITNRTFHILIDISRQEAFNRLTKRRICQKCGQLIPWLEGFKNLKKCDKCGGELKTRIDDKAEAINARLDYFEKRVVPAIDYYKNKNRLIVINGEQSIEKVFQDILKAISQK